MSNGQPIDESDIIAAPPHEHGPTCEHCGTRMGIERRYEVHERMIEMLLVALCSKMNLRVYRKGRSKRYLYVFGPDAATLDTMYDRARELLPKLDAEVVKTSQAFVRQHVGVSIEIVPPRGA